MDTYSDVQDANAKKIKADFDRANQNVAKMDSINKANSVTRLQQELNVKNVQLQKTQKDLEQAEAEAEYYKQLLCRPMAEIAQQNGDFKQTYEKQMDLMANWMVSQKAFKELAIQFGFEKGQTPEQTIQQGMDKEIDVLNNNNNPEHYTNADSSPVLMQRAEKMKEKIKERNKK